MQDKRVLLNITATALHNFSSFVPSRSAAGKRVLTVSVARRLVLVEAFLGDSNLFAGERGFLPHLKRVSCKSSR